MDIAIFFLKSCLIGSGIFLLSGLMIYQIKNPEESEWLPAAIFSMLIAMGVAL